MAEPVKDECTICTWVLIGAALLSGIAVGYMLVDLATDGKLSAMLSRAPGLATVTQLREAGQEPPGDSDAG